MPGRNPYRDAGADVILLGDYQVPGYVIEIKDADREYEWAVQKGSGTDGAITVFRGAKICEAFVVTLSAPDEDSFDSLYELRDQIMPSPGQKPPTFRIDNLVINFVKIFRVALKKLSQPKWDKKSGEWTLEVTFIEDNPSKPTKAGPADPAKPDDPEQPTQQDAQQKEIDDLMKKASKL